jgi:alanine racemase
MTMSERLVAAGLPPLPRNAWLEIDLDALRNNVSVFRDLIGPNPELMAVVKADAYGHGLVPVARALGNSGVGRLCVASIDEAVCLRDAGIEARILVLYAIPPEARNVAAQRGIEVTADPITAEHGAEVEVDTGLTRAGIKPDALKDVVSRISPAGLWTHIASPEDANSTAEQIRRFDAAVESTTARAGTVKRHLAATGTLLTRRGAAYEGVRIGLGLYGLMPNDLPIPSDIQPFAERLRPVMALRCMPLRVEGFPAGTAVGYGGTWVAQRESVIATLPVGYGDGFVRAYSPGAGALVRGRRVPLVGTVAMDAVMVDVTDVPGVDLADEFVLLGQQGGDSITAKELARVRNTIPWEVVTSMSFRLPRVYHAGSVLMGLRTLAGDFTVTGEA